MFVTPAATTYDLCWDEETHTTRANLGHISTLSAAGQYDMCWDDQPATLAAGYQGGFDMCWGDLSLEGHPTPMSTTGSVNSAANNPESSGSQDTWASLAPSSALTRGFVMAKLEAGEELQIYSFPGSCCHNIDHNSKGDNESLAAAEILDANRGLVSNYQQVHNQYVAATNDITKLQHMLHMFRQIDDPLTVLELGMKKGGG
ncbi:hypothetical protein BDR07DRAFT_1488440 [Suillus spraguei]|nr:hypothetical protein BDR07DRAFT_1488440 [Suillus spraguei]